MKMREDDIITFLDEIRKIKGGYQYDGMAGSQLCFPLKAGGELRFGIYDEDEPGTLVIDLYGAELPPGITGPVTKTGEQDV